MSTIFKISVTKYRNKKKKKFGVMIKKNPAKNLSTFPWSYSELWHKKCLINGVTWRERNGDKNWRCPSMPWEGFASVFWFCFLIFELYDNFSLLDLDSHKSLQTTTHCSTRDCRGKKKCPISINAYFSGELKNFERAPVCGFWLDFIRINIL